MIWRSLGDIITGKYGLNSFTAQSERWTLSAVLETQMGGEDIRDGCTRPRYLLFTANIGLLNLLPLPALDGGG